MELHPLGTGDSLGARQRWLEYIRVELEGLEGISKRTEILVLNVSARLALYFGHVVPLLRKMLDEHFLHLELEHP